MEKIIYNSPDKLEVGGSLPIRVNMSIGAETEESFLREKNKITSILNGDVKPDMIMDLSVSEKNISLWEVIRDIFDGPIGIIPHYLCFSESSGLNKGELLSYIERCFKGGVSFITVHCTPSIGVFEKSKLERRIPITSRGGGVVVRDMIINKRKENIFSELFDDICLIAKEYGGVINLGTSFRSSSVSDGLDNMVIEEVLLQKKFIEKAKLHGVHVVLEGPGHIAMNDIVDYWKLIEPLNVIPMPLGPIVTDTFAGYDHIVNAIGASNLMMHSKGGIINSVTAIEHLGGVPSLKHLKDGLIAAQIAAHSVSLTYDVKSHEKEEYVYEKRSKNETCILTADTSGCTRCSQLCPLVSSSY